MTKVQTDFARIPPELTCRPNWLLWRESGGKKVPYQAHAPKRKAKCTDPSTWARFEATSAAFKQGRDDGIGFALDADGLAVIDIDGDTSEKALNLLRNVGCQYIETSPSGNGLHGWGLFNGELPRKQGQYHGINVEIYSTARYMSVTGAVIESGPFAELALNDLSRSLNTAIGTQKHRDTETQETQKHRSSETQVRCGVAGKVEPEIDAKTLKKFRPASYGSRNRYLFKLARHLKARIPNASKSELKEILTKWHELALPTIGTQDFMESWGDFMRGWKAVRCAEGEFFNTVLADVENDPLPEGLPEYGERVSYLIRICARLQRHNGGDTFFLSARVAGNLLNLHYTNAANLLQALVADDVLELVKKGSRKGGQASEYRMVTEVETG